MDKVESLMYEVFKTSTLPGGFMAETFTALEAAGAQGGVCQVFAGRLNKLADILDHTECNLLPVNHVASDMNAACHPPVSHMACGLH